MSNYNKFSDVTKDLHMSYGVIREILDVHKVRKMGELSCHGCIYKDKCGHNFALFYYLQEQAQLKHCKSVMDRLYLSSINDKNALLDNQFEIAALKQQIKKLQKEVNGYVKKLESESVEAVPAGSEESGHEASET